MNNQEKCKCQCHPQPRGITFSVDCKHCTPKEEINYLISEKNTNCAYCGMAEMHNREHECDMKGARRRIEFMKEQSNKERDWEIIVAEIAINAHKEKANYGKFSETIYQGFKKLLLSERQRMMEEIEVALKYNVDDEDTITRIMNALSALKE